MGYAEEWNDAEAEREHAANKRASARYAVLEAAWDAGVLDDDVTALTDVGLAIVAHGLCAFAFRMGPGIWPAHMAKLRRAFDALEAVDDEAARIMTREAACPY